MTIRINSFSQYTMTFFKEYVIRPLTTQQKTILAISSLVIGCVVTSYVIGRYYFKAKLFNPSKPLISEQFGKQVFQKNHSKDEDGHEKVSLVTPLPQNEEEAIDLQTNGSIISGEDSTTHHVLSKEEKIKKGLRVLAAEKLNLAQGYTEKAQSELDAMTVEEKKLIQYPFQEFITNEISFRNNLEKLKTYKEGLDEFIKVKNRLKGEMKQKFKLKALLDLRAHLTEFIELLKIIRPFSNKIEKLKIEQLPTFVEIYLTTDFTPLLGIIKTQEKFNIFFVENKDLIQHLPEIIKTSSPEFTNTIGDVENIVASAFQRIGRYSMTLNELLKKTKLDSEIFNLIEPCYSMALIWALAINNWDRNHIEHTDGKKMA